MKHKPGYYVEGRYFGFSVAQATARAEHLSREWGRPIDIFYADMHGVLAVAKTVGKEAVT